MMVFQIIRYRRLYCSLIWCVLLRIFKQSFPQCFSYLLCCQHILLLLFFLVNFLFLVGAILRKDIRRSIVMGWVDRYFFCKCANIYFLVGYYYLATEQIRSTNTISVNLWFCFCFKVIGMLVLANAEWKRGHTVKKCIKIHV